MMINENLIVEIVRPGTGDPVADGEVGEVIVTAFNPDYLKIRLATGDSLGRRYYRSGRAGAPTCASRAGWAAPIRPPRSRACSHPNQVAEIGKRHPELGRLRLRGQRARAEQDVMVLSAECDVARRGP